LSPGDGGKLKMALDEAGNLNVANSLSVDGRLGIGTSHPKASLDVRGEIRGSSLSISGPVESTSLGFVFRKAKKWDYFVNNNSTTMITYTFMAPSYPIQVAVIAHGHAVLKRGALDTPIRINGRVSDVHNGNHEHTWGWGTSITRIPNSTHPIQSVAHFETVPNKNYTIDWQLVARWKDAEGRISAPVMFVFRSNVEPH
jgi:hypothetical protein